MTEYYNVHERVVTRLEVINVDVSQVITALITGCVTLVGVLIANNKQSAVMEERIEQLRSEVEKHNKVVERVYKLEGREDRSEARINKIEEEITYIERNDY